MVSAWDSSWLSMPFPDHLSCLSPPLPALGSGTGLSTQEMFKIQVLKCEELAGGGCPGGLCHAETVIVMSAYNCAQKHRFSTHFRVQSSAGLGGWGGVRERGAGRQWGKEGKKARRHGGIEAERGDEGYRKRPGGRDWLRKKQRQIERKSESLERQRARRDCVQAQGMERERERERCQPGSLRPDQVTRQRASERLLFE